MSRRTVGWLRPILATGVIVAAATPTPTPAPTPAQGSCPASLQALIDATPTGGTLVAPACVYRETVTIRRSMTVTGYGAIIDGRDASGATVRNTWMLIDADDVTVKGFKMRYANDRAVTRVGGLRVADGRNRTIISDCDLSYATYANLAIGSANSALVTKCLIHHGGALGVHLGGDGTNGRNNVLRDSRIYANNIAGFDTDWEAGGLKATVQTSLRLENNEIYDNDGSGFWCDIYCRDIVVTGNRVHHNTHAGIFFEVSTGATIRSNQLWENGWGKPFWGWGAGIVISSSGGADVSDNIVAWNYAGISVISQNRQDWSHSVTNNYVHDNTVIGEYDRWLAFWAQDWAGIMFNASSNNRGSGNRYWMDRPEDSHWRFEWQGGKSSLAAFNATPAEEGGRYLTDAEKTSILTNAGMPTAP